MQNKMIAFFSLVTTLQNFNQLFSQQWLACSWLLSLAMYDRKVAKWQANHCENSQLNFCDIVVYYEQWSNLVL